MRLGLSCGFWGQGRDEENLALVERADELGVDVFWAAEAYGPDVVSVLAWVGARTRRIGLGAGVMQIPARTPAATAMTAASLDSLSGGRFRLGLGVSGPQVSEGWHGVRFDAPLARTREYADIVRLALSRRPVSYQGRHFELPLPDGPGKPLRLAHTRGWRRVRVCAGRPCVPAAQLCPRRSRGSDSKGHCTSPCQRRCWNQPPPDRFGGWWAAGGGSHPKKTNHCRCSAHAQLLPRHGRHPQLPNQPCKLDGRSSCR